MAFPVFSSFSQVVPRVFPVFPKFFPLESLLFVSRKLSLEQAPLFAALAASASGRMKEFTTQRLGDGDGTSKPWNSIFFWDEASWFNHGLKSGKHRKNDVLKPWP